MHIAACLATERGLPVCAPVHDAFLICSPIDRIEADVAAMQDAMAEASRIALGGFELGTDAKFSNTRNVTSINAALLCGTLSWRFWDQICTKNRMI